MAGADALIGMMVIVGIPIVAYTMLPNVREWVDSGFKTPLFQEVVADPGNTAAGQGPIRYQANAVQNSLRKHYVSCSASKVWSYITAHQSHLSQMAGIAGNLNRKAGSDRRYVSLYADLVVKTAAASGCKADATRTAAWAQALKGSVPPLLVTEFK